MTLATTTIEEIVQKLTPDVVQGYERAENKDEYVGRFCRDEYHTESGGFRVLMDRLMKNTEHSLSVHGIIVPVSDR